MAQLEVAKDQLHVHLTLTEKVMAFHGSITVSLLHVRKAEPYTDTPPRVGEILNFSGTYVPGHVAVGSEVLESGQEVFYDVRNAEQAVAIELSEGPYRRLIVEVEDMSAQRAADFVNETAKKAQSVAEKAHRIHEELDEE